MQKKVKIEETKEITSKSTNEIVENYVKLHSKIKELQEQLKAQAQEVLELFDSPKYKNSNFICGDKVVCKIEEHTQKRIDRAKLQVEFPEIYNQVVDNYTVSACVQVRALKK